MMTWEWERATLILMLGFLLGLYVAANLDIEGYRQDPEHWHKIFIEQKK